MPLPNEDDREAIDRAFAALVADFERDAGAEDGYFPAAPETPAEQSADEPTDPDESATVDSTALFRYQPPPEEPEPVEDVHYVPEPLPPLPRLAWPALLAWIGLGYAVVALLAAALGFPLPVWAGWLAIIAFVGSLAVLITRLPRHRPPGSGNGAVL